MHQLFFVDATEFRVDAFAVLDLVCKWPFVVVVRTDAHVHFEQLLAQGVSEVTAGRVEPCIVMPGEEVNYVPTHDIEAVH